MPVRIGGLKARGLIQIDVSIDYSDECVFRAFESVNSGLDEFIVSLACYHGDK